MRSGKSYLAFDDEGQLHLRRVWVPFTALSLLGAMKLA